MIEIKIKLKVRKEKLKLRKVNLAYNLFKEQEILTNINNINCFNFSRWGNGVKCLFELQ